MIATRYPGDESDVIYVELWCNRETPKNHGTCFYMDGKWEFATPEYDTPTECWVISVAPDRIITHSLQSDPILVPEPALWLLLLCGWILVMILRWRAE